MQLESSSAVFGVGVLGGLISEFAHWRSLAKRGRLPGYIRSPLYWTITAASVAIAGVIAWLQFGSNGAPFAVLEIGLATPILIQKGTTEALKPTGGMGANQKGLFDFWTW